MFSSAPSSARFWQGSGLGTAGSITSVAAFIALLFVALGSGGASAAEAAFVPGQKWEYQTRPGEEDSTFVIGIIEKQGQEAIVHIAVEGLKVKNPRVSTGVSSEIGHLPISLKALRLSVTKMAGAVDVPGSIESGRMSWKKNKGGAFTVTLAQAIGVIEKALAR